MCYGVINHELTIRQQRFDFKNNLILLLLQSVLVWNNFTSGYGNVFGGLLALSVILREKINKIFSETVAISEVVQFKRCDVTIDFFFH